MVNHCWSSLSALLQCRKNQSKLTQVLFFIHALKTLNLVNCTCLRRSNIAKQCHQDSPVQAPRSASHMFQMSNLCNGTVPRLPKKCWSCGSMCGSHVIVRSAKLGQTLTPNSKHNQSPLPRIAPKNSGRSWMMGLPLILYICTEGLNAFSSLPRSWSSLPCQFAYVKCQVVQSICWCLDYSKEKENGGSWSLFHHHALFTATSNNPAQPTQIMFILTTAFPESKMY